MIYYRNKTFDSGGYWRKCLFHPKYIGAESIKRDYNLERIDTSDLFHIEDYQWSEFYMEDNLLKYYYRTPFNCIKGFFNSEADYILWKLKYGI